FGSLGHGTCVPRATSDLRQRRPRTGEPSTALIGLGGWPPPEEVEPPLTSLPTAGGRIARVLSCILPGVSGGRAGRPQSDSPGALRGRTDEPRLPGRSA